MARVTKQDCIIAWQSDNTAETCSGRQSELSQNPYLKSYIPSTVKTQMNIDFFKFLVDWAIRKLLKISTILLKYPTFWVFFSYFRWQNKYKIIVFVHCKVRTKKSLNIKLRKLSILVLKCTCFGQSRLKHTNIILFART